MIVQLIPKGLSLMARSEARGLSYGGGLRLFDFSIVRWGKHTRLCGRKERELEEFRDYF